MHSGTANGFVKRIGAGLLSLVFTAVTAALIIVAAGTAAGRWRVWPVHGHGAQTNVSANDALLLVPVSFQQIHDGDRVVLAHDHHKPALYRVHAITDSIQGQAQIVDEHGGLIEVNMPAKVWRMSRGFDNAGWLLGLMAGPIQAAVLVVSGVVLIARSERRRSREDGEDTPEERPARGWLPRSRRRDIGRVCT